jgi:cyclophilin family peptidyl-prolyl cis-trans isomerase
VLAPHSSEQDAKMVTFHTNHGDIVIKTFDDKAPKQLKTSWTTAAKVSTTTPFSTVLSTAS